MCALKFLDSFDTYATANLTEGRWTATSGFGAGFANLISPGTGRRGTASYRAISGHVLAGTASLAKTLPPQPTWIVGFAFQRANFDGTSEVCSLRDAGTVQVDMVLQGDGTLLLTRNGTSLGTTQVALNTGTYHYLELKVTAHNSAGSIVVRVDGVVALALSGIDTQATANAWITQLMLGNQRLGWGDMLSDYDDVYICDATGPAPYNDFLGDCRIDVVAPTSDSLAQWTPSTPGPHFSLVDEAAPDTADSLSAESLGLTDRFGLAPLPALTNPRIYAVAVNLYGRNPEAGGRQVAAQIESAAAVATGAALPLTDAWLLHQTLFLTDPNGGTDWTQARVNAAKVGATVVT
jgi:hypothetical protein